MISRMYGWSVWVDLRKSVKYDYNTLDYSNMGVRRVSFNSLIVQEWATLAIL